jgi:CheY-like chemotaxis protein
MKRSQLSAKTLLHLAIFGLGISQIHGADLEGVYNKYLQGNYTDAQKELSEIIQADPAGDELLKMKEKVGMQALLEMSQNQFLRENMRLFNAATWQEERSQFKSPRRIQFFIEEFLRDDSTRHRSMPNIMAAGIYAVPLIMNYLKVENENIETRGLAYQLLLNMGSEIVPALLPCTFSKDAVLQVSVIRLLAITKSPRAIPYLLRLQTLPISNMLKSELTVALAQFEVPAGLTPAEAYVHEANRVLCEEKSVHFEALESDRILWNWDDAEEKLVADNPLGLNFEYQPQYPVSIWPMFKAELMHRQFMNLAEVTPLEEQAIHAATLCTWAMQEHRIQELLKDSRISGINDIADKLKAFLEVRSNKLTVAQWLGQDILLQAIDMSEKKLSAVVSARLLRIVAGYQPVGADSQSITSFLGGENTQTLMAGLSHREELVRYWSAISIARCNPSLETSSAAQVVDLLQQATDEIGTPSALILAKPTNDAEEVHKKLESLGYHVQRLDNAYEGLAALRSFPSKDLLVLDPDFDHTLSGLELINSLRKDQKGQDLPVVILSDSERSGAHVITFQEQAQQMFLGSDSIEILREKLEGMVQKRYDVSGPDMAADVSREALSALAFADDAALRQYPSLVSHLVDLLKSPQQPISSQILAIRILRKLGTLSAPAINLLLSRLDEDQYDLNYKIVVLHSLLSISESNEQVRSKLFKIVTDDQSPDSFKQLAASYLSGEYKNLSAEERLLFQKSFFSPAFLGKNGS